MIKNKQVCLVLGANGFVGSHLVDELQADGYYVVAFDRFSNPTGYISSENIQKFQGDIYNDDDIKRALKGVDYVFHCFSATTPFSSNDDPYTDITKNLQRNVQIFELCAKSAVKKIIYFSSGGAVYGTATETKKVSEEDAAMPVSPYGICKLATENYLEYIKRQTGLDYIVYRLTNPYGPRQVLKHNQGVVPAFLEKVIHGRAIEVFGDGSSNRNYIYIKDATKMIATSFNQSNKNPIYNIGSEAMLSINDIILALNNITAGEIVVNYNPAPKTFLQKTDISIDRYTKEFGKPKFTDFTRGLEITLDDFKKKLNT